MPVITDLRIDQTFEDEAEEKGTNIIDLILLVLQLLRENI